MSNPSNTARLHRIVRAPVERVYLAFMDADALVKWLPPYGFTGKVHNTDAKVICGTELQIVQEGILNPIPTEFCYAGWQESLLLLVQLVEPEIPNE